MGEVLGVDDSWDLRERERLGERARERARERGSRANAREGERGRQTG